MEASARNRLPLGPASVKGSHNSPLLPMRLFRYWLVSKMEGMGHWLFKMWGEKRTGGDFPRNTKEHWRRHSGGEGKRWGSREKSEGLGRGLNNALLAM